MEQKGKGIKLNLHETISLKQVVGLFFALTAIVLLSS